MCLNCNCEIVIENQLGTIIRDQQRCFYNIQFGNIDYTLSHHHFVKFQLFVLSFTAANIAEITSKWNDRVILRQENAIGGYSFTKKEFQIFQELMYDSQCFLSLEKEIDALLLGKDNLRA